MLVFHTNLQGFQASSSIIVSSLSTDSARSKSIMNNFGIVSDLRCGSDDYAGIPGFEITVCDPVLM